MIAQTIPTVLGSVNPTSTCISVELLYIKGFCIVHSSRLGKPLICYRPHNQFISIYCLSNFHELCRIKYFYILKNLHDRKWSLKTDLKYTIALWTKVTSIQWTGFTWSNIICKEVLASFSIKFDLINNDHALKWTLYVKWWFLNPVGIRSRFHTFTE